LQNLMASTEIGTIFLDRALNIKRCHAAASRKSSTSSRLTLQAPARAPDQQLSYDHLADDAEQVLQHAADRRARGGERGTGAGYICALCCRTAPPKTALTASS
jgi:hypothetical protein